MEAIQTANKMFNYEQEIHGFTIDTWVKNAHKYNSDSHKWTHIQLKKGSFGYDNLAVSIGYTLQNFIFSKFSKFNNFSKIQENFTPGLRAMYNPHIRNMRIYTTKTYNSVWNKANVLLSKFGII